MLIDEWYSPGAELPGHVIPVAAQHEIITRFLRNLSTDKNPPRIFHLGKGDNPQAFIIQDGGGRWHPPSQNRGTAVGARYQLNGKNYDSLFIMDAMGKYEAHYSNYRAKPPGKKAASAKNTGRLDKG